MKNTLLENYKKNAWLFDRLLGEGVDSDEDEEEIDSEEEENDEEESDDSEEDEDSEEEIDSDEDEEIVALEDIEDEEDDIEDRVKALEDKIETLDHSEDSDEYEVDISNPVCPCCGARLNIKSADTDEYTNIANEMIDDEENEEPEEEIEEPEETTGAKISYSDDEFLDDPSHDDVDYIDLTSIFDDDTAQKDEDEDEDEE